MKTIPLNPGPVNVGGLAALSFRVAVMGDVTESDYRRFGATLGAVIS